MSIIQTIIIAIVEGLTEFLPVSSTGHMIIVQNFLGVKQGDPFVHAFTFIIQFGAILSVVCLYWKKFFSFKHIARNNENEKTPFMRFVSFYWLLFVGCIPAGIVGFLAKKSGLLGWFLDSVHVVAITLVLGGIFMLFCDKIFNKGKDDNEITAKRAFSVGLFQCLAVIPGMSRSMSTIVGGMANGLTRKRAAEFSFFVAVPLMAAATILDLYDLVSGETVWATSHNLLVLGVGCVVAFIVALLAMKWFVSFLTKYGFRMFGWYRIIVGSIILLLLAMGVDLNMVD